MNESIISNQHVLSALRREGIKVEPEGADLIWYCSVCGFGYAYFREQPPVDKMCCRCRNEEKKKHD